MRVYKMTRTLFTSFAFIISILVFGGASCVNIIDAQTSRVGTIVDNFLVPITSPAGICSDGVSLWVANYALVGGSESIYKINTWSHKVTDSIRAPGAWVGGIGWDGSNLWIFTDYPTINDFSIVKLSGSGRITNQLDTYPSCYTSGIAWDGNYLYYGTNVCSSSLAGQRSRIYKIDTRTGSLLDSIDSPTGVIDGLVYDGGSFWYCDDNYGYIFKIDTTGKILYEFPLSGLTFHGPLTGLAVAKNYLWAVDMAGVGGPRVYEIDIGETPAIPQQLGSFDYQDLPGKIVLKWMPSASSNVERYRIYRDGPYTQGYGDLTEASVIDSVPANITTYIDSVGTSGVGFAYWVSAVDSEGIASHVSDGVTGGAWQPLDFKLGQNYPNPFNPTTTITYSASRPFRVVTHVTITVYDILGRKVETLVDQDETIGNKTVRFDARNLPSGIYFYRMQGPGFSQTRKMVLIR